jgi:hypothetical protein
VSRPRIHIARRAGALAASAALAVLLASCAENFTTSPVQFSETLSLANWTDTIVLGDEHKLMGRVLDDVQRPVLDRTIAWSASTVYLDASVVRPSGLALSVQAVPSLIVARFGTISGGTTFEAAAGDSVNVVASNAGWADVRLRSTTPVTISDTIERRVTVAVAGVRLTRFRDTTLTAVGDTLSVPATALGRRAIIAISRVPLAQTPSVAVSSCAVEGCNSLVPFANQGLRWSRVGVGGAVSIGGGGDALRVTAVQDGTDTLVVSHPICAAGAKCADTVFVHVVTAPVYEPGPTAGGDVVVFNDVNMWQSGIGSTVANATFFKNLVNFGGDSVRASGTTVLFYTGAGAICASECTAPDGGYVGALVTKLTALGYTIENDTIAGLGAIPTGVKVLFVWNPTVTMPASDVNALKKFASEGGRVVIVGENGDYMGTQGLAAENQLLADLGAQLTNSGSCDVPYGHTAVAAGSHQLLTGVTELDMACASSMTPGPHDYVLFRDRDNNNVVGAVAKIDFTPILEPVIPY